MFRTPSSRRPCGGVACIHLGMHKALILATALILGCSRCGHGQHEDGFWGGMEDDEAAVVKLRILRPEHHSVVRRQSVEVEVSSPPLDGGGGDAQGHEVTISIDGKRIANVPGGGRFSVVLADEGLAEGVHEVTASMWKGGRLEEVTSSSHQAFPCTMAVPPQFRNNPDQKFLGIC